MADVRALVKGEFEDSTDVVVLGAGAAGIAAAIAAARSGARTTLVEAGSLPGGELISGMAVDGALNARGEWILGGVGRELFRECEDAGGFVAALNDFRLIWYVCIDPEVMKLAVVRCLARAGVRLLLHTVATGVEVEGRQVKAIHLLNKSGRTRLAARYFLDCSGDADLVRAAGGEVVQGGVYGELQPVSLMFKMSQVQTAPLLRFMIEHPEHFALGESEAIRQGRDDAALAQAAVRQGQPTVFLKGDGPLLSGAISSGAMYPTALIMIQPTAPQRGEVCLNTTRIGEIDGTRTEVLSGTVKPLVDQVLQCAQFMRANVPGFETAAYSGISHRIGVRETRRIVGRETLLESDVLGARKRSDAVAKGSHHVDIHQSGAGQIRIPVAGGGSYDIPWGCLLPPALDNLAAAGRIISSDRGANGSARVMGPCLGMGHAVGAACGLAMASGQADLAKVPVEALRARLLSEGAILNGTH